MSLSNNNDATIPNQSRENTERNHQASTSRATEDEEEPKMDFWNAVSRIIIHCIFIGYEMYNNFALIGFWKNEDLLIMPVIFVTACDTIYAIISIIIILISFESDGRGFSLTELFFWPEIDENFFDDIEKLKNNLQMKMYFFSILWNLVTCLTLLNLIFDNFKKKRNQIINYRNTIHEQRQQLERESMLSLIPPPPSYQDFADSVVVISPPQNGIPPPDYSIIEEHQIEPPAFSSMNVTEILQEDFSSATTSYGPTRSSSSIF